MADLWCSERLDEWLGLKPRQSERVSREADADEPDPEGWRSRFQQDYDRLLFSTPVRRLSDKTQVWPMDENDGVRTRLTHSHEVANLARSIGSRIAATSPGIFGDADLHDVVQPILSAIGLAHDLGNPPFGHQGETAISGWFRKNDPWIFANTCANGPGLPISVPARIRDEFLSFDGNPQSLRLVTKLQTSVSNVGLNLTAATLAASLKYPVSSENRDRGRPIRKKVGYFQSESQIVSWVREATGLTEGARHPLTWIMEACDDIAYSVLDVDDVMKKGIVSPDDVHAILKSDPKLAEVSAIGRIKAAFDKVNASDRRTEVVRDIKIGYLRAILIEALIKEASSAYVANSATINALTHEQPIMDESVLCKALKRIANQYAFSNSAVLRMEAFGAAAIDELMTFFWVAISEREKPENLMSTPTSARGKYARSLISPNYYEDAVRAAQPLGTEGGLRYRELRLLTDMVSGMTDTFAIKLWEKIRRVPDVRSD